MKALYRISILCVLVLISVFGIWFLFQYFYPTPEQSEYVKKETRKEAVPTSYRTDRTTCDTEYIVIEQDLEQETSNTYIEKIPDQYIDKTREQIISLLSLEEKAPILSEKEKGLKNITLSSFSAYRIVVVRQYKREEEKPDYDSYRNDREATDFTGGFYLIAYDDYVYVYRDDMKSPYMVTEICVNDLPEHLVQEIMNKKYLRDETDLYNFLESYSS